MNTFGSHYQTTASRQQFAQQQIQSLLRMRSSFPYSSAPQGSPYGQGPGFPGAASGVGAPSWGGVARPTPIDVHDTRLANGQTIEQLFADPYAGTDMGYLKEALDKVAAARRMFGVQPNRQQGEKGDLRVIAGDRADGVKPRQVRIDDANNYDTQTSENSYQDLRQEARFRDGTVGREYDVTVTWEDGTTTRKRVRMKEPGQIVYIRSADGY